MADHFQSSGNEMQQDSWELLAPNFHPSLCSFMGPRSSYIQSDPARVQGGAGGAAGGGRAASGDGSSLLDLPHVGLFGLMESNADNSILIDSNPFDLCMQQSVHYRQGGELEPRQLSLPAPPPQPPRRTNQQNYIIPTSRQLSRSVPSSPTFAASRLQANPAAAMIGGGGSSVAAPGRLPTVAKNLSAYLNASQQASSSASVLTASLDLACCASNLVSPSPGSVRSASFSSDQAAAAATASSFNSDHAANSTNFSCDHATVARTTNFTSDHEARSANLGSDQSSAATLASFSNDQAARSASFSELAAAASLFVAGFPSTPASSTTNLNATAAEQDHGLQAAAPSGSAFTAKKRRLQGVKISKGDQDELAATQDSLADVLPFIQGGANMDTTPSEPEISNNSANIEGKESTMKVNSSITSSSACMKTQVLEGTPPPKQDYIHVRARRGQATDSHSLAERVRREKISERMKFLQDLVPGCNKITGKAVMLDEIINYVQSLQRQVEFLSMKLSAVSPQTSKFEANHLINHAEPRPIQIGTTLHFNQVENHAHLQHDVHLSMPLLLDVQQQAPQHQQQSSNMDVAQAWEDELQSLVHTGFSTLP